MLLQFNQFASITMVMEEDTRIISQQKDIKMVILVNLLLSVSTIMHCEIRCLIAIIICILEEKFWVGHTIQSNFLQCGVHLQSLRQVLSSERANAVPWGGTQTHSPHQNCTSRVSKRRVPKRQPTNRYSGRSLGQRQLLWLPVLADTRGSETAKGLGTSLQYFRKKYKKKCVGRTSILCNSLCPRQIFSRRQH